MFSIVNEQHLNIFHSTETTPSIDMLLYGSGAASRSFEFFEIVAFKHKELYWFLQERTINNHHSDC